MAMGGKGVDRETQTLIRDLDCAIIKIRGAYAAWTRENGVRYHKMLVFYSICDNQTCSQRQICEDYVLPKQTVHNTVRTLTEAGYLRLVPSGRNRKGKRLQLTARGREYAKQIMEPLMRLEETAVQEMGMENIRTMTEAALRYGKILENGMARCKADKENGT